MLKRNNFNLTRSKTVFYNLDNDKQIVNRRNLKIIVLYENENTLLYSQFFFKKMK